MKIYFVNTGRLTYHEIMRENDIGMLHIPYSWRNPVDGLRYCIDNGQFHYWKNGLPFDRDAFLRVLKVAEGYPKPDFVVCPDIVAGGKKSLDFSMEWLSQHPRDDYYFVVQDGMTVEMVEEIVSNFEGLFVGGTRAWKWRTVHHWVRLAHRCDVRCHIGRVGSLRGLWRAKGAGADSVDSASFVRNGTVSDVVYFLRNQDQRVIEDIIG